MVVCSRRKKEIFWAQKTANFACERSREDGFFFALFWRKMKKMKKQGGGWNRDDGNKTNSFLSPFFEREGLNEQRNNFFIFTPERRQTLSQTEREFKTHVSTQIIFTCWGTHFKHKEEEATTTTTTITTTTVLWWLSLVLLLHELEEWLSGLPLPLPLLPVLLRWVVLNNNNNFKIKNKRWCYER